MQRLPRGKPVNSPQSGSREGAAAPVGAGRPLVAGLGLHLSFSGRPVLKGVDIEVASGEIVTVIGPNGAGKTTLLRVLIGLIRPDAGSVERRPGLRIGYLPQRMPIDPVLPLEVGRLMTLTRRAPPADVDNALAETGVEHLCKAPVSALSGGELQRVLLARALLARPDLLVLDEPLQGVDYAGEAALYQLIGGLRARRGCGVLMISHDLHVVMAATDRVLCLNRHVCCAGTPDAVSRHPEYVRLFGRQAAGALAVYAHRHDHQHDLGGNLIRLRTHAHPPEEGVKGCGPSGEGQS
jgi:zinc transport system ATP-binding protein